MSDKIRERIADRKYELEEKEYRESGKLKKWEKSEYEKFEREILSWVKHIDIIELCNNRYKYLRILYDKYRWEGYLVDKIAPQSPHHKKEDIKEIVDYYIDYIFQSDLKIIIIESNKFVYGVE